MAQGKEQNHPVERPEGKEHLDFLTGIILAVVGVATVITSIGYSQKQRVDFYASAGFMPSIIGAVIFFLGFRLAMEALKGSSVRERVEQLRLALVATVKSARVHKAVVGLIMFGIYIFLLLGNLPFWLASFLTLAAVLIFVHFDGRWITVGKMLLIAALAVAAIVLLFQVAFSVPMP